LIYYQKFTENSQVFLLLVHLRYRYEGLTLATSIEGMRISFLVLIILLLLSGEPASAEWVAISAIDEAGVSVYIDPDTIRRQGSRATISELIDYANMQTVAGTSYMSVQLRREYDCAGNLHRTLAQTKLSGHMGTGEVTLTDSEKQKWEAADPGSLARRLWKVACDKP
jgi:hypothetical protein